jgi:serine/threonine protein kinase
MSKNKINKNNNNNNNNYNQNTNTIEARIFNIKNLISNAHLEPINPLKTMDSNLETEFFEGPKENKSMDTRTILGKKTFDFYNIINRLNSKLIYIKSGAYGNTFKGIVTDDNDEEIMSFAVKVVAFPKKNGYGSIHNATRPENSEICMLKLLSYFVIKSQTPHLILPIATFNTSIKPFLTLQDDDIVSKDNKKYSEFISNYNEGQYYENVSVIISEWANRGDLSMFLKQHYKKLKLIHWQCIFFQIISTLAIIQTKYPTFRHNDLKANNILISKVDACNKLLLYKVSNKEYVLPAIGYGIYLWDFDFACIPSVVENSKVYQDWTQKINITSRKNRYYDIHYFFCTLIYKGFLPEIIEESNVPIEVKKFIEWIVPPEYRPGHNLNKVNKRCRLLVDDELYKPIDILDNDFFSPFQNYLKQNNK